MPSSRAQPRAAASGPAPRCEIDDHAASKLPASKSSRGCSHAADDRHALDLRRAHRLGSSSTIATAACGRGRREDVDHLRRAEAGADQRDALRRRRRARAGSGSSTGARLAAAAGGGLDHLHRDQPADSTSVAMSTPSSAARRRRGRRRPRAPACRGRGARGRAPRPRRRSASSASRARRTRRRSARSAHLGALLGGAQQVARPPVPSTSMHRLARLDLGQRGRRRATWSGPRRASA